MKVPGLAIRVTIAASLLLAVIAYEVRRQTAITTTPAVGDRARTTPADCRTLDTASLPQPAHERFRDVTDDVGLEFQHVVGPVGTYFMPEVMGAGGGVFDADGDGLLDIYLVNCGRSPQAMGDFPAGTRLENRFYRQTSQGKFVDITAQSGLGDTGFGAGCAVGDIDNDGDLDVYVTNYGPDRLFQNAGDATFIDVSFAAGIDDREWSTGASFLDYDRDGWLDLFVVHYTADPEHNHTVACGFVRGIVSYCGPHKFLPTIDRLYRNEGAITDDQGHATVRFTDVTEETGLATATTFGLGVICADLTGDGWIDIYVANDSRENRLWVNTRDGRFLEEGVLRGVAFNQFGTAEAGMGIALGDIDRDGQLDLLVTNLTTEGARIYSGLGNGLFEDRVARNYPGQISRMHTGWGTALVDLDHDSHLDLVIVNGLVVPCYSRFPYHGEDTFVSRHDAVSDPDRYWRDYWDANLLFLADRQGRLREDATAGGDFTAALGSGRALIHGDIDNDGDIDLLVTNCGDRARLYRNDMPKVGHWLSVRVIDPEHHRDALGAEIVVTAGLQGWTQVVQPASSYLASNDIRVHVGLGAISHYDQILVRWPDGPVETASEVFAGGPVDRLVVLRRGEGRLIREP